MLLIATVSNSSHHLIVCILMFFCAGKTPLHLCTTAPVAEVLLRNGSDVSIRDSTGKAATEGPRRAFIATIAETGIATSEPRLFL